MGFVEYIWPQEWVLRFIIIGMWILVGFVIQRCMVLRKFSQDNLAMLQRTENVAFLEKALKENDVDVSSCFLKYEQDMGKGPSTEVLFEHLRAIYDAGVKSSRLDADILVKNSISKMFTGVDFLKTSISLFLVIGILGTLAGLAISIGGFNGANFVVSGQASTTARELSALFGNLRGAFAPSMWGVFFTITFVFAYTWFIQEGCINKLTEKLTINTIKNWLPVLYPTDFQRGDNSIVKLNATIKNADGINKGVNSLQKNLTASNKALQELANVSELINSASVKFDKSTDKIVRLKALYDQLRECNNVFNESIHELIDTASKDRQKSYEEFLTQSRESYAGLEQQSLQLKKDFIEMQKNSQDLAMEQIHHMQERVELLATHMQEYFDQLSTTLKLQTSTLSDNNISQMKSLEEISNKQHEQLQAVLEELKNYDTNFFRSVSELRVNLTKSVDSNIESALQNKKATEILQALSENLIARNNELIEAITKPLQEQLTGMSKQLTLDLQQLSERIGRLSNPLDSTALQMQTMAERNMTALTEISKGILAESVKNMQQIVDKINSSSDMELKETCSNINMSLQTLNQNMQAILSLNAANNGVDPHVIEKYMNSQQGSTSSGKGVEAKLEAILQYMERKERINETRVPEGQRGFLNWKKMNHIPLLVIVVLMFVGIIMQGVMVSKISDIQKTQIEINQQVLKGDLNNNEETNSDE